MKQRKLNRLSKEEIKEINELISEGKSLNEITRIMNKNKTTVYYHFRKIKGRTINQIILNSNDEELIGEFIRLFAGDGSIFKTKNFLYRTYLHFNINEKFAF